MNFKEFFKECNEKKVFKNLSIYIVSSWILIQVFAILWEPFGLPKISMTYLLLILILGFPVYIYILWKYGIKSKEVEIPIDSNIPLGKRRASSKSGLEPEGMTSKLKSRMQFRNSFNKMYFTLLMFITAITVLSASFIVKAKFGDTENTSMLNTLLGVEESNKIAVLPFDNNTMDTNLDVVGKMAVDWIMHGITQNKVGQVISPKIVEDYTSALKASIVPSGDNAILKDYLKPSKVINGTYYLNQGRLLLQCSITDGNMNTTLISFEPVECDSQSPLTCIEALKQKILGYLITEGDNGKGFEETPPDYEAYQLLLEAKTKYTPSDNEYIALLNKAIETDPDYYEAKIDRLEYYYNRDEFAMVDSLYHVLNKETSNNKRKVNLLNWYEALLEGDNRNAYNYFKNEYNLEPFDLKNNSTAMVLALQFVNRPQDVDTIYDALSMDDMDLAKCRFCEFRNYVKALADIELGKPEEVVKMFAPFAEQPGYEWIKEALISAYIELDQTNMASEVLDNIQLTQPRERWHSLLLFSSKECLVKGDTLGATTFLDKLIASLIQHKLKLSQEEHKVLAMAYYYKGEYQHSIDELELFLEGQLDPETIAILAIAYGKNGNLKAADETLKKLESLRGPYQYGAIDYGFAQYYAVQNENQQAMSYLLQSVADGKRFNPSTFQHDIHFKPLFKTESFKKILDFWK